MLKTESLHSSQYSVAIMSPDVPVVGSSSNQDKAEEKDDNEDNDEDRSKIGKGSQKKGMNKGREMVDHRSMKTVARAPAKRGINEDYDNEDDEDENGDEGSESQLYMAANKGGKGGRRQRKKATNEPVKKARVSGRGATSATTTAAEPKQVRNRTKSSKYND